jgi:hypothetical protein
MILWHWTPKRTWDRLICWQGLWPCCATGIHQAVWLCTSGRLPDVRAHCAAKHRVNVDDLVLLRCRVQRRALRSYKRSGIWFTFGRVWPAQIRLVPVPWSMVGEDAHADVQLLADLSHLFSGDNLP